MVRLILIRHGECEGQGSYIGRGTDPPLSEKGRMEVSELGTSLVAAGLLPPDRPVSFYISPMLRAAETAEILLQGRGCKDRAETVADLAEIDFGIWDGKSRDEIAASAPEAYSAWIDDPYNRSAPGGESLESFSERVLRAVDGILIREEGDEAVVVAHGGVIRAVICRLLGLPAQLHWSFSVSCASFSVIQLFPSADTFSGAVLEKLNCR